jgi:hypothetical protein
MACDRSKDATLSRSASADAKPREKDPAKRQQARLAWHRRSLLEAYQTVGRQRASWDNAADQALELFAEIRSQTKPYSREVHDALKQSTRAAMDAGCNDPLIAYLYARFVVSESGAEPVEVARMFRAVADELNISDYNSLAKFYGSLRAAEASTVDIGPDNQLPEHVRQQRYAATTNLIGVLRDRTTPVEDIYQATHEWLATAKRSPRQFAEDLKFIEPGLQEWGDDPLILLARAECSIDSAWNARGSGYADSVTPEGWKLFGERLTIAKQLLEQAWKADSADPRIANAMLDVAVGLSFKRPEMEQWFERAMKLETNNYPACQSKLHYLKPQWHGSAEEMLAFGRQCVSNKWGGEVPLTLVDAHQAIVAFLPKPEQGDYWKDDGVWRDVENSFEKFFLLNPDAAGYRHNYAWYAFHAGRWKTFNEQLPLLQGTNYAYFGGKERFDEMVAQARQRATAQ